MDRTKEYSFVLSIMARLHARSRLLELGIYLSVNPRITPRGGGVEEGSILIYWLYGYEPLERVWFSSHLLWDGISTNNSKLV